MLRQECVHRTVMAWLVGLVVLGCVGQAHGQPRGLYGALAFDRRDGSYGFSYDYPTQREADERALQKCGPGCVVVEQFSGMCAAYAMGDNAAEGRGRGIWHSEAERQALAMCQGTGTNCRIRVWGCTTRPATAQAISNAKALVNRGAQKADRQDYRGAIADYTQALRFDPDLAEAYYNRGVARAALEDRQGALEDYTQAIHFDADFALAYGNRGAMRAQQADWKGAVQDLTQAIRLKPEHALFYRNRGIARAHLDDKGGAIEDLQTSAELCRRQRDAAGYREVAEAFSRLGEGKFKTFVSDEGRQAKIWQDAVDYYTQAIRLRPDFAEAYAGRGGVRHLSRDARGAIEDYTQAIRLDPNQAHFYSNRGNARYNLDDWKGVIEDYTHVIQLKPQDPDAYRYRGDARYELGDKQGALADYSQAVRLKPDQPQAYDHRGIARAELGDKRGALEDFQQAAQLYQKERDDKAYQRVLGNIQKLQQ